MPRTRPPYPEEFRREAVRLARLGDKPQRRLAKDLGISDVSLRRWIREEQAAGGERPGGLSSDDLEVARQISAAARSLGLAADPSGVQQVQVNIDALAARELQPFWAAVLGYAPVGDEDVFDPRRVGPPFTFQQMDAPRPQRNRIHIDVYVPRDQVEARIKAALAAGGHMVNDTHAPNWWTLADAEGNEVDLAIWG